MVTSKSIVCVCAVLVFMSSRVIKPSILIVSSVLLFLVALDHASRGKSHHHVQIFQNSNKPLHDCILQGWRVIR